MYGVNRVRALVCVVLAGTGLTLAGCGGVTRDRYKKVELGMTRVEIEAVLGKGAEVNAKDVEMGDFVVPRTGPPGPGESPESTTTREGLPPFKDLKEKATWVRWGNEKKYVLVAFIDDKAVAKTARIPG